MKACGLTIGGFATIPEPWKAWTECDLAGDGACYGKLRDLAHGARVVVHRIASEPRGAARALFSVNHHGVTLWGWMDTDRMEPEIAQLSLI